MEDTFLNVQNIIENIAKKQKIITFDVAYDFLPILIKKDSDINNYVQIINPTLLMKPDQLQDYDYCWFIPKSSIIRYVFCDKSEFIININLTAVYLWENHLDDTSYFTTWIYALCEQILRTSVNNNFTTYIAELANSIIEFAKNKNIELPKYKKRGKQVLPQGLYLNNKYCPNEKDLIKMFSDEIYYIKANYYICPVNDIRLLDQSEGISEFLINKGIIQ